MSKMGGVCKLLTCWCISGKKGKHAASKGVPIIFIFGTGGSGKATVGQKLAESMGFNYLNASALVENEVAKGSFKGKLIEELRKTRSSIPAEVITGIITDNMPETAKGFVIAAFPNNVSEAKQFELELRKPNAVVYCCIPDDVYLSRCGKKHGITDEKVAKQNYMKEHKASEDVFKYYEKKAVKLVTTAPVAENNDKIKAGFKKVGFIMNKS